jgi:hypothetical protein
MAVPTGLADRRLTKAINDNTTNATANAAAAAAADAKAVAAIASGKKVAAPASASSTGTAGNFATDTGFIYVCTATNTWKRVAIATW